ncbi:hypothetical protein H310_13131 [Aphanomyces invadans]|uniref:Vacuolar protein 8 n=1 Tax=Aphanomyces invadans TaxID=157072 RepID=A0A024TEV8_9STRA|nr:hypothetical protein H310_13131 [Aphanomyces invadans]ETV92695.1 hypothetical protein H310_13131 [Aphanomyces invadans]|eukprot:XP_008878731.1 hypothetical protein H310_13131 [Aphanomyces invadans]
MTVNGIVAATPPREPDVVSSSETTKPGQIHSSGVKRPRHECVGRKMNLDLLWEHEKRRVAEGGAGPMPVPADGLNTDVVIKPKATTTFKLKKGGSVANKLRCFDTPCIPPLSIEETIFERNGYALDYESHMTKRLSQPPAGLTSSTYHAAASSATSTSGAGPPSTDATCRSSGESIKTRAVDTPKKRATLRGAVSSTSAAAATSPIPARHDKLSLNSLLKTAARPNQPLTYRRTEVDPTASAPPPNKAIEERAIKAYMGDYFSTRGEYVDGMLYMSRMKKSHGMRNGSTSAASVHVALDGAMLKEALASATADSTDPDGALSFPGALSTNPATGGGGADKSTQAQRCASTLANWSSNPANARVMVNEGVVQALMILSRNDDIATRVHCVTTFMNLSNVADLRQGIIQLGAVKTLVGVLSGCDDRTLQTACALTLCNLCCLAGEEVRLVADSAVGALTALVNDAPGVAAISERALFNLTCVAEPYAQIDVVIKALVSLASSASSSSGVGGAVGMSAVVTGIGNAVVRERTLHMCAMAFVNLSNMKRVRSRLMEEGIVPAISALLKSHNLDVKHWAVYVLCNIASMRSCRSELVTKGALNILVALAPHPTLPPKTLLVIGTILCHLSKEPSIRHRLVVEGLLSVVAAIGRADGAGAALVLTASDDIRRVCATAIHNCSCSDDTRVKLVERDGVALLTALSSGCDSPDVRRMCTLALCNFLMVKQAAMEVVGCGAVASLLDLATQHGTPLNSQLLYATAFYNLCHNPTSRDSIGTAGGVAAIAALCTSNLPPHSSLSVGVLTLCAASLCYLAADDSTRHFVATADVVHVITCMLQTSPTSVPIQRFGVACLSMLSQDQLCATWILDQAGIDAIIAACANSRDGETKACCCDLLASLSYHTHCRHKLVAIGILPSLTKLAKLRDPDIQRRCAAAIGNLASEASVHDALLAANIVHVLSILSNSYSEESQSDCAKALCNLSTSSGFESKLVAEGAVGVLLMISAVRSGSLATKETCARALGNLLMPSTMDTMLHEGLAKLLPALTTGGDGPTSPVPATIFAKLVRHPHARLALCAESQALRTLFNYMSRDGHDPSTMDLLSSIVCDLLVYPNTRHKAVADGLVAAIADLARRTLWSSERLVSAVLLLAASDDTRMDAIQDDSVNTLLAYLEPTSGHDVASPVSWMVVTALCHLGWHDVPRSQLHDPRVVLSLVSLVLPRLLALLQEPVAPSACATAVLHVTLLTLASLAFRPDHATTMLQNGLCPALVGVATLPGLPPLLRRLVCLLLRQMSHVDAFHTHLQVRDSRQPVLGLLCTLCLHPSEMLDDMAALDCADALYNIAAVDGLAPKLVVEVRSTRPATPVAPDVIILA